MPKLALAPLFILWFGIGLTSKVALVASIVFFLIFFSTAAGVRGTDVRLVAMARVAGASEEAVARHVVWPGAVPYVFAGLKISLSYAIGAAVVGELISSNRGLGYLIQAGSQDFDTTTVFAALAALTLLIVAVNAARGGRGAEAPALASRRRAARASAGGGRVTDAPVLLEVRGLGKRFAPRAGRGEAAVRDPGPVVRRARGRVPHDRRPVRLGQVHAPEPHRPDRRADRRARSGSRAGPSRARRRAAAPARLGPAVRLRDPGRHAAAVAHAARERALSAARPGPPVGGDARARAARAHARGRARGLRALLSTRAVRRHAQARRPDPDAGLRSRP